MNILVTRSIVLRLGPYVKDLKRKDVELQMLKGTGQLLSARLNETTLEKLLQLPECFEISEARCGRIDFKVPWSNITKEPIRAKISNIVIEISERGDIARPPVPPTPPETTKYGLSEKLADAMTIELVDVKILYVTKYSVPLVLPPPLPIGPVTCSYASLLANAQNTPHFTSNVSSTNSCTAQPLTLAPPSVFVSIPSVAMMSVTSSFQPATSLAATRERSKKHVILYRQVVCKGIGIDIMPSPSMEDDDAIPYPTRRIVDNLDISVNMSIRKRRRDCSVNEIALAFIVGPFSLNIDPPLFDVLSVLFSSLRKCLEKVSQVTNETSPPPKPVGTSALALDATGHLTVPKNHTRKTSLSISRTPVPSKSKKAKDDDIDQLSDDEGLSDDDTWTVCEPTSAYVPRATRYIRFILPSITCILSDMPLVFDHKTPVIPLISAVLSGMKVDIGPEAALKTSSNSPFKYDYLALPEEYDKFSDPTMDTGVSVSLKSLRIVKPNSSDPYGTLVAPATTHPLQHGNKEYDGDDDAIFATAVLRKYGSIALTVIVVPLTFVYDGLAWYKPYAMLLEGLCRIFPNILSPKPRSSVQAELVPTTVFDLNVHVRNVTIIIPPNCMVCAPPEVNLLIWMVDIDSLLIHQCAEVDAKVPRVTFPVGPKDYVHVQCDPMALVDLDIIGLSLSTSYDRDLSRQQKVLIRPSNGVAHVFVNTFVRPPPLQWPIPTVDDAGPQYFSYMFHQQSSALPMLEVSLSLSDSVIMALTREQYSFMLHVSDDLFRPNERTFVERELLRSKQLGRAYVARRVLPSLPAAYSLAAPELYVFLLGGGESADPKTVSSLGLIRSGRVQANVEMHPYFMSVAVVCDPPADLGYFLATGAPETLPRSLLSKSLSSKSELTALLDLAKPQPGTFKPRRDPKVLLRYELAPTDRVTREGMPISAKDIVAYVSGCHVSMSADAMLELSCWMNDYLYGVRTKPWMVAGWSTSEAPEGPGGLLNTNGAIPTDLLYESPSDNGYYLILKNIDLRTKRSVNMLGLINTNLPETRSLDEYAARTLESKAFVHHIQLEHNLHNDELVEACDIYANVI